MKKLRHLELIAIFLSGIFFLIFAYNFIEGNDVLGWVFGVLLALSLAAILFIRNSIIHNDKK